MAFSHPPSLSRSTYHLPLYKVIGSSGRPVLASTDCPADGIWPRTPQGVTASVPCDMSNKSGLQRTRACGGPAWGPKPSDKLCEMGEAMGAAFGKCGGEL